MSHISEKFEIIFFIEEPSITASIRYFLWKKQFKSHSFYLAFPLEKDYLAFFREVALKWLVTFDIKKFFYNKFGV